eukprot:Skav213587  [mRNA]  locus=scaffold1790:311280:311663:+ [translate_table: standard]
MASLWPANELEKLECAREWRRNVCLYIGRSSLTEPVVKFWVALTCAQLKLSGDDPMDVDDQSIGAPVLDLPITQINKINPYQMMYFKQSLEVVEQLVTKFEDLELGLMLQVQNFLEDVTCTIQEYPY